MSFLSEQERQEMLRFSESASMRKDMEYLSLHRHNPVLVNGAFDMDRLIEFLSQFNEFINHQPKPFLPMIEKDMKL
jgi:hypothetical protein